LVKLNDHVNHTDLENTQQSFDHKFRQYLPYSVILKYLKEGIISKEDWYVKIDGEDKPYQEETRPHNTIQEGTRQVKEADGYFIEKAIRFKNHWSLAIGLDRELPSPVALRLGGEGHRVILQRCTTLDQQWVKLQTQSNQNFTKGGKAIAYLITPGVFERIHQGKAMCRAWPWEWKVSEGNLAGVATDKAIPINSRIQSKQNTSIPAPQVFAAPQGSQYYLNKPDYLFADSDNPNTKDIQSSQAYQRAKRYLDLGYSKLFWLNYRGE
jgi:CRISPR-associated protein Cmr3